MNNEQIIEQYKQHYFRYHGEQPLLRKSGAWLYINEMERPFRVNALIQATENLKEMFKLREEEKEKEGISRLIKLIDRPWSRNIKPYLIFSFLDRILEKCGNSTFEMEKVLKDFAFSGMLFDDEKKGDCLSCWQLRDLSSSIKAYKKEIERLRQVVKQSEEGFLKRLEARQKYHKEEIDFWKREVDNLKQHLKELRENSVLFTMNDLNQTITKKQYRKRKRM